MYFLHGATRMSSLTWGVLRRGTKPTPGRIASIVLPIVFGIIIGVVAWIYTRRALAKIRARAEAHHPEHVQALEAEARGSGPVDGDVRHGSTSEISSASSSEKDSVSNYKDSHRKSSLDGVHAFVTKFSGTKSGLTPGESSAALLELAERGSLSVEPESAGPATFVKNSHRN
jgi:hypothetical protein